MEGAAGETSMDRDVRTTRQDGWAARVIAAVAIGAFTCSLVCLGILTAPSGPGVTLLAKAAAQERPPGGPVSSAGPSLAALSTQPATRARSAGTPKAESRPLSASRPASSLEDRRIGDGPGPRPETTLKVIVALLVVVLVLLVLRKLMRGASRRDGGAGGSAGSLEVVASLRLSPTHQVRLVRLGQRLIAVGMTPQAIAPLAEVSDPREIVELLEQAGVKRPASTPPATPEPGTDYLHDATTRDKPPSSRKGEGA